MVTDHPITLHTSFEFKGDGEHFRTREDGYRADSWGCRGFLQATLMRISDCKVYVINICYISMTQLVSEEKEGFSEKEDLNLVIISSNTSISSIYIIEEGD